MRLPWDVRQPHIRDGCATVRLRRGACSLGHRMKLLIFVGINLGGYVGWELGERFGMMTAFLLSGAGSVLGVFAGWWTARKYLA